MERPTRSDSRNLQAPTGETPVVVKPQDRIGEFTVPAQRAEAAEVFTAQQSGQDGVPQRRTGPSQKPPEQAPSGELYRGSLIRELRKARGLDSKTVSAALGYDRFKSYVLMEGNRANASPAKMNKLAELLDVPVAELQQAPVHPRTMRKGLHPSTSPKEGHEKPPESAPSGELYRGSFIRELRKARGLETKSVAAQLGHTRARTLKSIEGNHTTVSPTKLDKLAELLDVPVAELQQAPVHPRIAARRRARAQLNH
jgi:transcriptional regulator with XRE-family HTH domain